MIVMYYIDELNSLTKTIDLSRDELDALHRYSDWKVHFPLAQEPTTDLLDDSNLRKALGKLKRSKLFMNYVNIMKKYANQSPDIII